MEKSKMLLSGPPPGKRPLPGVPQPSAPNRFADASNKSKRERPAITVVDAQPMDKVGFRAVHPSSKPTKTQEEPVNMRQPPSVRPPSSFRRSMPINMDKVGYSLSNCDAAEIEHYSQESSDVPDIIASQSMRPPPPPRNLDLLSDVPASAESQLSPPSHRISVPCGRMVLPLPPNRGPPPPLPKKSPSVPNLLSLNGNANWSIPSNNNKEEDTECKAHQINKPTIIRPQQRLSLISAGKTEENVSTSKVTPTVIRPQKIPTAKSLENSETSRAAPTIPGRKSVPVDALPLRPTIIRPQQQATVKNGSESSTMPQSNSDTTVSSSVAKDRQRNGALAGGVRVFPFTVLKPTVNESTKPKVENQPKDSTNESIQDTNAKNIRAKPPPAIKPKPALMPKPELRPKPATGAKPQARAQSSAFASSLNFAQMLEEHNPTPSKPRSVSVVCGGFEKNVFQAKSKTEDNTSDTSESQVPHLDSTVSHKNTPTASQRGPMKATYRPTIIRAAVKSPEEQNDQSDANKNDIGKRLLSSCTNLNMSAKISAFEFNNESQPDTTPTDISNSTTTSQQSNKISTVHRPTMIRPGTESLEAEKNTVVSQTHKQKENASPFQSPMSPRKSVSFVEAAEIKPLKKYDPPQAPKSMFHFSSGGSILKPTLSMSNVSGKNESSGPPPRPGPPPTRKSNENEARKVSLGESEKTPNSQFSNLPPSPRPRRSSASSVTSSNSVYSSEEVFTVTSGKTEGKKRPAPQRPSQGPTRRSSTHSPALSSSPPLPGRPNPGHPLFHYLAQGPHAVALFDYTAQHEDELSFRAGCVIELVKQNSAEWLTGRVQGKEGMFPANFVDAIHPLPTVSSFNTETENITQTTTKSVEIHHTSHSLNTGPHCIAVFDYTATHEDDLSFRKDDVIRLISHEEGEWLRGELHGKSGIFPRSYVDVIQDLDAKERSGSLREETPPPLPLSPVPSRQPSMPTWNDEPAIKAPHFGVALHDFNGEEGELSFQVGAKIHIISRLNDNWLYGEMGHNSGTFPANFIDHVPTDLPDYVLPETDVGRADESHGQGDHPASRQEAQESLEEFLVTFDFAGEANGDLPLQIGQRVQILERLNDEWARGRLNAREGIFPLAFVQSVSIDTPDQCYNTFFTT